MHCLARRTPAEPAGVGAGHRRRCALLAAMGAFAHQKLGSIRMPMIAPSSVAIVTEATGADEVSHVVLRRAPSCAEACNPRSAHRLHQNGFAALRRNRRPPEPGAHSSPSSPSIADARAGGASARDDTRSTLNRCPKRSAFAKSHSLGARGERSRTAARAAVVSAAWRRLDGSARRACAPGAAPRRAPTQLLQAACPRAPGRRRLNARRRPPSGRVSAAVGRMA